jgi:Kdo2-lipid IVA lauroyltransferase/acyltransferase
LSGIIFSMLIALLKLLSRVPMRWHQRIGVIVGWSGYWCARTEANRLRDNLYRSGICSTKPEYRALLKQIVSQTGQGAAEWLKAWYAPQGEFDHWCAECHGWEFVEAAQRRGKGIIFLLPHLGSFSVAVRYSAQRLPLTVLYRVPREPWRNPVMLAGAQNAGVSMAPADLKGVEMLLQALKRAEAVALPPDQAPNSGGGEWADFFGRPAYTMTLAKKLQRATGAALIAGFAERLPHAKGYRIHYYAVPTERFDEVVLNRVIEDLVRRCPSQYNWNYNRYKIPRAARKKWRAKARRAIEKQKGPH